MDPILKKRLTSRVKQNYIIIGILLVLYMVVIFSMFIIDPKDAINYFGIALAFLALIQASHSTASSIKTYIENRESDSKSFELLEKQMETLNELQGQIATLKKSNDELIKLTSSFKSDIVASKDIHFKKVSTHSLLSFHIHRDEDTE